MLADAAYHLRETRLAESPTLLRRAGTTEYGTSSLSSLSQRPGPPQRLVHCDVCGRSVRSAASQLVLGIEHRTLCVQHLEEIRHTALKPNPGVVSRTLAGRGGVLQSREARPGLCISHQRGLGFLHGAEHSLLVLRF